MNISLHRAIVLTAIFILTFSALFLIKVLWLAITFGLVSVAKTAAGAGLLTVAYAVVERIRNYQRKVRESYLSALHEVRSHDA